MRPGQQNNNNNNNKRMRGRNRKGPNPLTRSYESNGPDVKIRGTALHIAEKYVTLARDAQSSGDRVMAESYLQHAEHYFRLIAAAQAQTQTPGQNAPFFRTDQDDDGLDEEDDRFSDRFGQHDRVQEGEGQQAFGQNDPQPFVNGNGNGNGNGHYQNGQNNQGGNQGGGQRERGDRQDFRSDNRDRQEPRQEPRQESRQEPRQDARPEGERTDNRGGERQDNRGERPFRQNREGRGERRERGDRQDRSMLPRFVTGEPAEAHPAPAAAEALRPVDPATAPQPVAEYIPAAPIVSAPPAPAPAPVASEPADVSAVAAEEVAPAADEEGFRPRRRRTTRARTRRADDAEPTLDIAPVVEE